MKPISAALRRRLATDPLPTVRVHGRSTSLAGATIRRAGARKATPAMNWLKKERTRTGEDDR